MYKIFSKVKHGGIWDGKRIVKELETDNASLAEQFKAQGYEVEEIGKAPNKNSESQSKK